MTSKVPKSVFDTVDHVGQKIPYKDLPLIRQQQLILNEIKRADWRTEWNYYDPNSITPVGAGVSGQVLKVKKQKSYWLNFHDRFISLFKTSAVKILVHQTVRHHLRNSISKMENSLQ